MAADRSRVAQNYLHGVSAIPLMGLTVGQLLARTAARFPRNDALVVPYQNLRWSFSQLNRQAEKMAAGL